MATGATPGKGVPFACHIQQRVAARVRTRYRQEWFYALRFLSEISQDCSPTENVSAPEPSSRSDAIAEPDRSAFLAIREAVADLPESQRGLIEHIFWHGRTETELALVLGIGQRAVNKRKQAALDSLRADL